MLTDNREFDEIYEDYKNLVLKAAYTYSGNYDVAERYYSEYVSPTIYLLQPHESQ